MATLKEILTRRPVAATIRLTMPSGGAKPAPPVGPAMGQYRLNLMAFCKDFNADPEIQARFPNVRNHNRVYRQHLLVLRKVAEGVVVPQEGGRPGHVTASTVTLKHVYEIAKIKQSDPYCQYMPLESISKSIIGAANSMGIKVQKELD